MITLKDRQGNEKVRQNWEKEAGLCWFKRSGKKRRRCQVDLIQFSPPPKPSGFQLFHWNLTVMNVMCDIKLFTWKFSGLDQRLEWPPMSSSCRCPSIAWITMDRTWTLLASYCLYAKRFNKSILWVDLHVCSPWPLTPGVLTALMMLIIVRRGLLAAKTRLKAEGWLRKEARKSRCNILDRLTTMLRPSVVETT